jgi:hypothetical protein
MRGRHRPIQYSVLGFGSTLRADELNRKSPAALMRTGTLSLDLWRREMATQTTRGRSKDRAKVAGGQDHEVKYAAGKTGASKGEVKSVVKSVGNSRKKVEDKLGKK